MLIPYLSKFLWLVAVPRALMIARWGAGMVFAGALAAGSLAQAANPDTADVRMRGSMTAPVTLIEYSDFTCGYCLKFFRETWPRLQAKYVDPGKVRFLYRDYPRGDQGAPVEAAVASRCAGEQGRFWPMHDRLFGERGQLNGAVYERLAGSLDLNRSAFARCLQEGKYLRAILHDREEAGSWGLRGTPGFILMRTDAAPTETAPAIAIPGAFPFEVFEEEIEKLLASAPPQSRDQAPGHLPSVARAEP
jgi:protein-disulfide isomerase